MDATFIRSTAGLVPQDEETREWFAKVKLGGLVFARVHQPRNPAFHRKMFALFKYAYDFWSETAPTSTYKGERVLPDFERFRKDITIIAGFHHAVVNLRGEVRMEADSLSFGSMSAEEFEKLYSAVINVLLQRVFIGNTWSEEQLRSIVDGIVEFS